MGGCYTIHGSSTVNQSNQLALEITATASYNVAFAEHMEIR